MAYLHQKRLNFIEKDQNESRYPQVDIKQAYLHEKIPKQAGAELGQAQAKLELG